MMGKPITMDQLRQDVGNMVEKITKVIAIFRQFQLKMEEYVCLKVIAMVSQEGTFITVKVHSTMVQQWHLYVRSLQYFMFYDNFQILMIPVYALSTTNTWLV